MAFAAITDVFTMTVSYRLSLGLAAGFFVVAPLVGLGWETIVFTFHSSLALGLTFALSPQAGLAAMRSSCRYRSLARLRASVGVRDLRISSRGCADLGHSHSRRPLASPVAKETARLLSRRLQPIWHAH